MKKDRLPLEDQWKSFDFDIQRVGLIVSSQLSFYCFTHSFPDGKN